MKFSAASLILTVISVNNLITCDACNCSHCEDRVMLIDNDNRLDEEDLDGDGSRTICARDRDHEDQTFPSICHMMCYNRCSEFHLRTHEEYKQEVNIISASRTNYYRLHDGPCPKRMKKILT